MYQRNKIGKKTKVEHRRVGGGVASHKWWERPTRQTEGMSAISIREGGGCLSVYACACERRVGRYSRMMRGEDMVVVSMCNYIGRSTIVCPRKGET